TIQIQSAVAGRKISSNNHNVQRLSKRSNNISKKIISRMNVRTTQNVQAQKKTQAEIKENQSTTKTVTTIGKYFSYVKYLGMAMMMVPYTAAAGEIVFNVGQYGEMLCYATNSVLHATKGNWLCAAASLGSAVLSYTGASASIGKAVGDVVKNVIVKKALTETTTKLITNAATAVIAAGMEAGKNSLNSYAAKEEQKDYERESRRKALVRFDTNKLSRMKNNRVQKVYKPARA
ncbi:MAG: hypothetical protein II085_02980, partial [Alphaproteobacteria bacterium]|nr:hypothetical protein [Alphaproteobacteria bacterium]